MVQSVPCRHCGGPLQPIAKGRTGVSVLRCEQCHARSLRLKLHPSGRLPRWLASWLRAR